MISGRSTRRSTALAKPSLTALPSEMLVQILLALGTPRSLRGNASYGQQHMFAFAAVCQTALLAAEEALQQLLEQIFDLKAAPTAESARRFRDLLADKVPPNPLPDGGVPTWIFALRTAFHNLAAWRHNRQVYDKGRDRDHHHGHDLLVNVKIEVSRCTARTRRMKTTDDANGGDDVNNECWFVGHPGNVFSDITERFCFRQRVARSQCEFGLEAKNNPVEDDATLLETLLFTGCSTFTSGFPRDQDSFYKVICRASDPRIAAQLQGPMLQHPNNYS